jgi:YegS/Rv2252/BmrU family lipid kinase
MPKIFLLRRRSLLLLLFGLLLFSAVAFKENFTKAWLRKDEHLLTEKKKVLFVINPNAGAQEQNHLEKLIKKRLDKSRFTYEIEYTQGPKHATALSKKAVKEKFDIVAAVGGDGTVNEVAKGLIGSKTSLAIIPAGSGNGLARNLEIPINPKDAIEVINRLHQRKIDTVKINQDSYFCVAGIGFDARISSAFSECKRRGFSSYLIVALNELADYKPKVYEMVIDGKSVTRHAFLISFANSNQYGNNAYIAPQAQIDDGYLDILILREFPPYATPKLVIDLFNKTLDHSKYIETIRCKEVIVNPPFQEVHIDGEPVTFKGPLNIKIRPLSLTVITP